MIRLTERLKSIADEVEIGETVADIGTDHGFLPVYLLQKGISPRVVMTDVSPASLAKAEKNCMEMLPGDLAGLGSPRLGDGLSVVEEGECDCLIMAGMGGILMTEILDRDKNKAKAYGKLIFQPRNNPGRLRHWLYNNGFSIVNEKLVREKERICEIITAIPKEVAVIKSMGSERIEYQYPHSLVDFVGPLTKEYLSIKLNEEKKIYCGLSSSKSADFKILRSQAYRVEYLERMIESL